MKAIDDDCVTHVETLSERELYPTCDVEVRHNAVTNQFVGELRICNHSRNQHVQGLKARLTGLKPYKSSGAKAQYLY